jgi:uncharacterized protein (TIGR03067 family)
MRVVCTYLVFCCVPILVPPSAHRAWPSAQDKPDPAQAQELKKFQGKWQATAFIIAGVPVADDQLKATSLTVSGQKFILKTKTATVEGEMLLDPSKSPRTIDIAIKTPDGNESKMLGIYEWNEGRRKSCFGLPNIARPGDYLQQKGYVILEWEKTK